MHLPTRPARVAAVALAVLIASMAPTAHASLPASHVKEVARLALNAPDGTPDDNSGWLILDSHLRRGYQIFETYESTTVIQSFDLDTLAPRRRVVVPGSPLVGGGLGSASPGVADAGEVVHAVDRDRGLLYLPLSDGAQTTVLSAVNFNLSGHARRPVSRFLVIDEGAFDRGDPGFASSFTPPAVHAFLSDHQLLGLAVDEQHSLLLLFAATSAAAPATGHWLVRWDVSALDDPLAQEASLLTACSNGAIAPRSGTNQWPLLVTQAAVWLMCQDGLTSAAVSVGRASDGSLRGEEHFYPGALLASDVLVDEVGARLVARTSDMGSTVTVFDTATRSFSAPVAVPGTPSAIGTDATTGRVYVLGPDGQTAGGLGYVDTRPAGPFINALPALANEATYRIAVDPPTRHFFVRAGTPYGGAEPFYRVFVDRDQ